MKAVILAGGKGTRLSEETQVRPKPMVEIGGRPILWHILKGYAAFGIEEFIICLGYKGYVIKEYFANYALHMSSVTLDLNTGGVQVHENTAENWRVTLLDTGDLTMTGGRLKRAQPYVGNQTFCCTYGDGLSNVDIAALVQFHQTQKKLATLTATQPPGRFGALGIDGDLVTTFEEKPVGDRTWINGGFFVLEPAVFAYLGGDESIWERDPLQRLAQDHQLAGYRHPGFWHPMDTLRDRMYLEELWEQGRAPWKTWK